MHRCTRSGIYQRTYIYMINFGKCHRGWDNQTRQNTQIYSKYTEWAKEKKLHVCMTLLEIYRNNEMLLLCLKE